MSKKRLKIVFLKNVFKNCIFGTACLKFLFYASICRRKSGNSRTCVPKIPMPLGVKLEFYAICAKIITQLSGRCSCSRAVATLAFGSGRKLGTRAGNSHSASLSNVLFDTACVKFPYHACWNSN